jgi:monoamine oxidase
MAEDGQQFHGDACVVSVPITALQHPACAIQFVPPLPNIKRQAIQWCVRAAAWHNQFLLDLRILDFVGAKFRSFVLF